LKVGAVKHVEKRTTKRTSRESPSTRREDVDLTISLSGVLLIGSAFAGCFFLLLLLEGG